MHVMYLIKWKMQPGRLSVSSVHPGVAVEEAILSYLSPPGVHATARLLELHSRQSPLKPSRDTAQCDVSKDKVTLHSNETNTLMHLRNDLMSYKRFIKVENLRCLVVRSEAVTTI